MRYMLGVPQQGVKARSIKIPNARCAHVDLEQAFNLSTGEERNFEQKPSTSHSKQGSNRPAEMKVLCFMQRSAQRTSPDPT